ncbi:uncharacterized protein LOC101847409 [Aplysia californica]|uniref:Uncharacterized protein LOC101847409 n=1 Tax=Aplysia californica TaxID=6500 RepID=A0ABM0JFM6_APLCA|nr:uncharacterized protein LOC101847409 [Aplysia californica]
MLINRRAIDKMGRLLIPLYLCLHLVDSSVITVLIQPRSTILPWSEPEQSYQLDDIIANETIRVDHVIHEKDLITFYRDVYLTSPKPLIFIDLRHHVCPFDIFPKRLLAYVTRSLKKCPHLSQETQGAKVEVTTQALQLLDFLSEFLVSWDSAATKQDREGFALLFDETGEDYFLLQHRKLHKKPIFEITLPLYNCSSSSHVTNLAANTNTKDVVVIAQAECIHELLMAVSLLRLPPTRFRWLLYSTDDNSVNCNDSLDMFCDVIKPVLLTERDKPKNRLVFTAEKILSYVHSGINIYTKGKKGEWFPSACQENCAVNCSECQEIFQQGLGQIPGQEFDVFRYQSDDASAKDSIIFDLHRLLPNGQRYIGNWSKDLGLDMSELAYPADFIDSRLTVVVVVEPPFVFRNDSGGGVPRYYGYSMDVLDEISRRVGFSYTVRECDRGGYGVLKNGEWTGCIGNVVRGEADVVLGALTVTAERDRVVDFSLPYYDFAGIQILMKRQAAEINLFYYANVFTTFAWCCLGAVVVATSLLLYAFEKFTSPGYRKGQYSEKPTLRSTNTSVPLTMFTVSNGSVASSVGTEHRSVDDRTSTTTTTTDE